MTRIFITGGTGYVGGRIAQAFLADGNFEVCVATRGSSTSLSYLPGAQVVQIDLDDVDGMARHMAGADHVFHMAAANEIICGQGIQQAVRSNILHGVNTLQAAQMAGVRRFINFSTAHVYGALHGFIDETCLPAPTHPYAITHLGFEGFVNAAMRNDAIEGVNIRLSNSFGAPIHAHVDRWSLLANDLCRQAATHNQIVLKTDGSQTRDFVTLSDVANISVGLVELSKDALDDGVFNLGGNRTSSILEMAQMVAATALKLTGEEIPVTLGPPSGISDTKPPLIFSTDKISRTGLGPKTRFEDEMESLMFACLKFFRRGFSSEQPDQI
ncbi:NAD(P)-dependent oxidoreductase [Roseovarius sp. EL26]|uniref:NAD-dependent epimerase/dehydratase family protein n=1 Tax=Roseovarius sp. EL26 TaxID=2126672 RepID=UPI000EA3E32E|nr:NAD(P)-dependent oxidoreductase [Roseovarius sp. EL26]